MAVFPIYDRDGRAYIDAVRSCSAGEAQPDSYHCSRDTISETTLILLLGEVSDRRTAAGLPITVFFSPT